MSLSLSVEEEIAVIKMDDGKVNTMGNDWFKEINIMLDEVESKGYHGLIIQGRTGVYMGGLNIKWLPNMSKEEVGTFSTLFPRTLQRIHHLPIPTVAALSGHAIAGGCIVACGCDWRVAIKGDYRFQMNEVLVNMSVPEWAIEIVEYVIPKPWVNSMLGYGEPLSFQKASEIGVINRLVEDEEALYEAALDQAIANKAVCPGDFAVTKGRLKS